jgi:hypothetical protein
VTPKLHRVAAQFYPASAEAAQALERYSDEELELLNEFLRLDCEWNEQRLAPVLGLAAKRRPRG